MECAIYPRQPGPFLSHDVSTFVTLTHYTSQLLSYVQNPNLAFHLSERSHTISGLSPRCAFQIWSTKLIPTPPPPNANQLDRRQRITAHRPADFQYCSSSTVALLHSLRSRLLHSRIATTHHDRHLLLQLPRSDSDVGRLSACPRRGEHDKINGIESTRDG